MRPFKELSKMIQNFEHFEEYCSVTGFKVIEVVKWTLPLYGDFDVGDAVMLVIESWWRFLNLGDIFWMLRSDAYEKKIVDIGDQNVQNRHQHFIVIINTFCHKHWCNLLAIWVPRSLKYKSNECKRYLVPQKKWFSGQELKWDVKINLFLGTRFS